ncbi:MAG: MBL fold metallo-hydrolase [Candidatus Micrarchaeota archaeon]
MKTFVLFAGLLLFIGIFGCIGEGQTPPPPPENKTNESNKTGINIIIGEQKNQTAEKNETEEPPPENVSETKELEYTYDPEQKFGIYFIDVGGLGMQGDAILIKKGDCDILVDAGSAEKGNKVVDFLHSHDVDDIEVLISTNADPRHYGGISAVADRFKIEEFWWNGESFADADYAAIATRMEGNAKTVRKIGDGFSADLNGINFTALNPPATDTFEDVNNDAIVLRVTDRNFSMLLTSGIQTGAQGRLINQKTDAIKTEIMQAPYYGVGQGTSNIGVMLITAKPKIMIISGSNDESAVNGGSREPFKRLMTQYGIKWYENYVNGTVRVTGDGQTYSISMLGAGQ